MGEIVDKQHKSNLDLLAEHLVTPERYGHLATSNVYQLHLVEAPELYPSPNLPDAA